MNEQSSSFPKRLLPEVAQPTKRPYQAPRIERVGNWSVLTLAQSVPIVIGGLYRPFTNEWSN